MLRFAVVFLHLLCIASAAFAEGLPQRPDPWEKTPRELHLFGDFVRRLELAEDIVAAREGPRLFSPEFRRHLLFELGRRSVDELQEMRRTGQIAPNAIGDTAKDLVYTPVLPCRAFDTRFAAAGRIQGDTERAFFLTDGGGFGPQGGNGAGCGIPYGSATAVHINLIAVNPAGTAFVTAWPYSSPRPFISLINFYNGTNLANAVTVPVCNPAVSTQCAQGDMSIYVSGGASADMIGDVLGYYSRFPVEARRSFAWDVQTQTGTTIAASCTSQTGASIAVSVPDVGKMYVEGTAVIQVNHTVGAADSIELMIGTSSADCTSAVARATKHVIPAAAASANNYQFTLPVSAVFAVDPAISTTATYFLNARNLGSTAGADAFVSSQLTVTFHPD